jgi:hypothetical protein
MGYYTEESSSPAQLLVSTVSDELKAATAGESLVFSIAPFRDAAILGAGHAADGAYWINNETGKWASTTYYTNFPQWLNSYNDRNALNTRIDEMSWTPLFSPLLYDKLTVATPAKGTFKYRFSDARQNKYKRFVQSPCVNDEVNKLTEQLFNNTAIGIDHVPDFLSLTYYAGRYNHANTRESAMEIQDAYLRIDRSLSDLLDMLDKKVGLRNVLFVLTSTGYNDAESSDVERFHIPTGAFYPNRCTALLNMYLMALYGNGQYIEGYYNGQIYLNHKYIEQKQLNLVDIQEKAAEFLVQFSGIDEVFSANRLLLGAWSPSIQRRRNAFHRKLSGDLWVSILPGWSIINENSPTENPVMRYGQISMPLIFLGNETKPEIIRTQTDVDRVAATLSQTLRIRAPNACTASPLELK